MYREGWLTSARVNGDQKLRHRAPGARPKAAVNLEIAGPAATSNLAKAGCRDLPLAMQLLHLLQNDGFFWLAFQILHERTATGRLSRPCKGTTEEPDRDARLMSSEPVLMMKC